MSVHAFPEIATAQSADVALGKAVAKKLAGVMILGTDQDGCMWWQSSRVSKGEALLLLEMMRAKILEDCGI